MIDLIGQTNPFDLVAIITKWIIYGGVVSVIGGLFMMMLITGLESKRLTHKQEQGLLTQYRELTRYMCKGAIIGGGAVVVNFFLQVGSFAEDGWAGLFDPTMSELLWLSDLGSSVAWRITGFSLALLAILIPNKVNRINRFFLFSLLLIATVCLAYSFTLIGHSTELGEFAKWLVALHVVAIGVWIGSLLPLWSMCSRLASEQLKQYMESFGRLAMFIVAIVALTGGILLTQLLQTPMEIITSNYGLGILIKLSIIALILMIAALHKFNLVPGLSANDNDPKPSLLLKRSIGVEILIACLILSITAIVSSILGPEIFS